MEKKLSAELETRIIEEGKRIEHIRKEVLGNISIEKFAEALGVSPGKVSRWCNKTPSNPRVKPLPIKDIDNICSTFPEINREYLTMKSNAPTHDAAEKEARESIVSSRRNNRDNIKAMLHFLETVLDCSASFIDTSGATNGLVWFCLLRKENAQDIILDKEETIYLYKKLSSQVKFSFEWMLREKEIDEMELDDNGKYKSNAWYL